MVTKGPRLVKHPKFWIWRVITPEGKSSLESLTPASKCSATDRHTSLPVISTQDSLAELVITPHPTTRNQEISPFLCLEWGRWVNVWWTALLTNTLASREAEVQIFSSLFAFLSTLILSDGTSSVSVSTAGNSSVGPETVISTVFWKHHSCLGNAIVTKWYGSRIGAMTSLCPVTLWNFGKVEQMRLQVGTNSTVQVLKWFRPLSWKTSWNPATGEGPRLPGARYLSVKVKITAGNGRQHQWVKGRGCN